MSVRADKGPSSLSQRYSHMSLRKKLVVLISGVSVLLVSIFMLASFFIELNFFRARLLEEYQASTRMVADNLQAAVLFRDELDASEILSSHTHREYVMMAGAYLTDGALLASYRHRDANPEQSLPPPKAQSGLMGDALIVSEPILSDGITVGQVVLVADLGELRSFLWARSWVYILLLLISIGLAFFIASRIGRRLSRPILELAATAQRITEDHDFSTRQERTTSDETGKLVDAFNEMMAEIEKREDAILQAKERAEASNRAKDDFLSVISHELRTPLNPIIGYVEILLRKITDAEDKKQLALVKQYSEHLQSLIDGVIDYSRFERGVVNLSKDIVDYRRLCQNIISLLKRSAEQKGITLSCAHCDEKGEPVELTSIYIDRVKMQQIVLNLVANAIKFTEKGSINVSTRLTRLENQPTTLRIEVQDTGIGIAEEDRDKVFKPFSQIDESLTRQYSGLGLGLAITRKIVAAMNGEIDFVSEKGVGSTFWIEIPVTLSQEQEADPSDIEAPLAGLASTSGRVLLVDDQLVNLELGESMLSGCGLDVVCARSGAEAIEKAAEEQFRLIILDIKMPRMNGYETARKIREMELNNHRPRVPIIAMTAHVTTRGSEQCFEAGMDDFLPKPFNTARLNLILQKWLGAKSN